MAANKVVIELSRAQVEQVVGKAAHGGTTSMLLSALRDQEWTLSQKQAASLFEIEDRRLSRSLLTGLLVLCCFPIDGGHLGIAEVASTLDMSPSTTHRYVTTLMAVGLLEQDPGTRQYRVVPE